jgi:hypothetical protein
MSKSTIFANAIMLVLYGTKNRKCFNCIFDFIMVATIFSIVFVNMCYAHGMWIECMSIMKI